MPVVGGSDMILSVRQLREKRIKQKINLYQAFVDLTKTFDTVNMNLSLEVSEVLICLSLFLGVPMMIT